MLALPFFLALVLLAHPAGAQQCPRGTLTGIVTHVRDGDTIVVGRLPIRLNGLAAPDGNEPGGAEATAAMRAMVDGRELRRRLAHARSLRRDLLP